MSYKNSVDDLDNTNNNNDLETDLVEKGQERAPVSAGTRSTRKGDMEMRAPPGPASSKVGYRDRSRSNSVSSVKSHASSSKTVVTEGRRKLREAAREANRFGVLTDDNNGEGEELQTPIHVVADTDDEESGEGSKYQKERDRSSRKRRKDKDKGKDDEDPTTSSEEIKEKRGRPQTTGEYVKRGEAIERMNKLKREALDLEAEKRYRSLSASDVRSRHEPSVEEKREELELAPTVDVAQRARESMIEVWRVATISRNLKGNLVSVLKQAAAVGTASAEVLCQRADNHEPNDDTLRELRELRRQLERTKREAQSAKEETDRTREEVKKLREELEAAKGREGTRRRVRAVIEDSPPSSPFTLLPPAARENNDGESIATTEEMEVDDPTPDPEIAENREMAPSGVDQVTPEYSDERRRAEIMPPRHMWPPVRRAPIRGKVKILEDERLETRGRLVEDVRRPPSKVHKKNEGPKNADGPRNVNVQSIMDALAPKMIEWLRTSLSALGLTDAAGDRDRDVQTAKKKSPIEREMPSSTPNPKTQTVSVGKKGLLPTTEPNKKLFSNVVAGMGKQGGNTTPAPSERRAGTKEPMKTADQGKWTKVEGRKKKKANKVPPVETKAQAQANKGQQKKPNTAEQAQTKRAPAKPVRNAKEGYKSQGTVGKNPPKRKTPRTAAVTLTCPQGEYAQAMKTAREKINLREMGIETLRPRRAATGAIILEIPGPDSSGKAVVLRDKMEEALRDMEGVRVVRPVKMGELRIGRILDATTVNEIKEAIARLGGCSTDEVRTGDIRAAPNGLGTMWAQCPIVAANKAAAAGRLNIGNGWSSPTVQALEPRQLHCFRCLEPGHVQAGCPSSADRRGLCYRCSREGHLARACGYAPRCVICEEAGRPSAHKMGGKACKAPGRKAGPPRREKPPNTEHMEVEEEGTPQTARGGSTPNGGAPVAARRNGKKKEHQPAVRGGSAHHEKERAPVPGRLEQDVEAMEVEVELDPATAQPPQGNGHSGEGTDEGASKKAPHSLP